VQGVGGGGVILSLLALSVAAQAEPPLDCANPITQTDMNQCSAREFQRADTELNRAWSEVRAAMQRRDRGTAEYRDPSDRSPGYYAALLESQRAWLRYRDAHCLIEGYAARGGSMEPMLVSGCRRSLTEARTQALRDLLEN
jgi:uncharacterized protein YecT (DUF1311 family)